VLEDPGRDLSYFTVLYILSFPSTRRTKKKDAAAVTLVE
jgi:hypothetical protein